MTETSSNPPTKKRSPRRTGAGKSAPPVLHARVLAHEREAFNALATAAKKKPGTLLVELVRAHLAQAGANKNPVVESLEKVHPKYFELSAFNDFAMSFNKEPGTLLRQILEAYMYGDGAGAARARDAQFEDESELEVERLIFCLPSFLWDEVKKRAEMEGLKAAKWVSMLVQSVLMTAPVLTDKELEVVSWSNRELAAIGRNLNQIARSMNRAELVGENFKKDEVLTLEGIREVDAKIKKLRAMLLRLVAARHRAWGVKDDPAS